MNDYPKEFPSPGVNILEIGPRQLPSTEFFDQYPNANIVFVANESFAPYHQNLPPGATTVEADVVDYLESNDPSIPPEGFDFILVVGVFSQPLALSQPKHIHRFIQGVANHLKSTGALIIEYHYLGTEVKRLKNFLADKIN